MLLQIDPTRLSFNKIDRIVDILRMGGVIICPTDTVYSFACDLFNIGTIKKLAKIKKKEENRAEFSIICSDLSMMSEYVMPVSTRYFRLIKKLTPGPYTIILRANNHLAGLFPFRRKTIGIRIPDNPIPRQIAKRLGRPLVTTSLKEDTGGYEEYRTDPEYIYQKYYRMVDVVIDGGFGRNEPSTIIDLTHDKPKILREGLGDVSPILEYM